MVVDVSWFTLALLPKHDLTKDQHRGRIVGLSLVKIRSPTSYNVNNLTTAIMLVLRPKKAKCNFLTGLKFEAFLAHKCVSAHWWCSSTSAHISTSVIAHERTVCAYHSWHCTQDETNANCLVWDVIISYNCRNLAVHRRAQVLDLLPEFS